MEQIKMPKFQLRGGSWYDFSPAYFRAHFRVRGNPDLRCFNQGFRYVSPENSAVAKRLERIG